MRMHFVFPAWPKLEGQTRFDLPAHGPIQAAASVPEGVDVSLVDENVAPIDFSGDYDLVGISVLLSCQAPRAYEVARQFRERGVPVVMGGLHVSLCPEEAAEHADAIVVGEGEGLIEQMIADFRQGGMQKMYRRQAGTFPDIAAVPPPRRDLYDKSAHYAYRNWELPDLLMTSRGCRFNCYPCCTPYLGGRLHRIRPLDQVIDEMRGCSDLMFITDNSLEQNVDHQKALFKAMAEAELNKSWVSHPISPRPDVLKLAKEAGCWYVYHAIYTISDKIHDRIKMFHDHGIKVEGTILLGMDGHTEDFIKRFVDFLLTVELDLAEFTILTPFPHTQVWEEMESQGRIIERDWAKYNAGNVVFTPAKMSPDKLQELYHYAWESFYRDESQYLKMGKILLEPAKARRAKLGGRGATPA
jgi:radical SAM superfamily enzyme YgiQ (UPF0313 family)